MDVMNSVYRSTELTYKQVFSMKKTQSTCLTDVVLDKPEVGLGQG